MKVSFGVVWRERGEPETPARLEIGPHSLLRRPLDDDSIAGSELGFDEIEAVEIRPPDERPTLVLRTRTGREVEIESAVDTWILGDLLAHVFIHAFGGGRGSERLLLSMRLRPGVRERALELLRAGPPFDPSDTSLALHDVFLLADEAFFLFATRDNGGLHRLVEPDFWHAASAWRELSEDGVRLAEPVYSWSRDDIPAAHLAHLGLGL